MKNIPIVILSFLLILVSCRREGSFNDKSMKRMNESYVKYKNEFIPTLIDHFPNEILRLKNSLSSNTDIQKDNIGLYLYQYNMSEKEIDSISNNIIKRDFLRKYNSKEECLFKVSPFETLETIESYEKAKIISSVDIDKECYEDKLPIPNFVDFHYDSKINIWEHSDFEIYVFNAEKGLFYEGLEVPSEQMPKEWGNGYSKGIALSRQQKIVIYWMVIW